MPAGFSTCGWTTLITVPHLLTSAYTQDLQQQAAAGFLVIPAVHAVQERFARLNLRRLHLARADLLPNPRQGITWTCLFMP